MKSLILGCGRVGAGLAQRLSQRGQAASWWTRRPPPSSALSRFTGQTVLGAALDREVLLQAGIERVDGLAAITGSDDTNSVGASARQVFRVPRVVARLHDPRQGRGLHAAWIHTIMPLTWGIQRLTELPLQPPQHDTESGERRGDIVEVELSPLPWAGPSTNSRCWGRFTWQPLVGRAARSSRPSARHCGRATSSTWPCWEAQGRLTALPGEGLMVKICHGKAGGDCRRWRLGRIWPRLLAGGHQVTVVERQGEDIARLLQSCPPL